MVPGSPSESRLRIGVMLDSLRVPNWVHKVLSDVLACEFLEPAAILLMDRPRARSSLPVRWARSVPTILFRGYEKLDRALFRAENDAVECIDASRLLAGTRTLQLTPTGDVPCRTFADEDIARVRSERLDVILKFCAGVLSGPILEAARYGVWSLRHGQPTDAGQSSSLFWEIYERRPVSSSVLEILADPPDARRVIYRSFGVTDLSSLYRNRNKKAWKASDFVMRRLRDLWERGADALASADTRLDEGAEDLTVRRPPGNWTMVRFLAALACRFLYNRYETHLLSYKWFLAVRARREFLGETFDASGFEVIRAPKGRFWADPFLLEDGSATHVFFEDVGYADKKGVISHLKIDADGTRGPQTVVLEREYHLSYPFVFRWQGQVFMIPETAKNRTIELYRATAFPLRWELDRVLFEDVYAVDTTLLEHAGRFWLFANMSPSGGAVDDELFLFFADSPLGPWRPHPMNPIVSDVRSARPAGRPFAHGQDVIRPSQDGSGRYGNAILLNRIETLSETGYGETCVARIEPDWHPRCVGTHTINRGEALEVIDGYEFVRRWSR